MVYALAMEMMTAKMKICRKCSNTFTLDEFPINSHSPDGRSYWCGECHRTYSKENRDKEKTKWHSKTYYQALQELRSRHDDEFKSILNMIRDTS